MSTPRHKGDSKTFEDLDFAEQAKSMNATAQVFRRMLKAHLRRAQAEGRPEAEVLASRLGVLERILKNARTAAAGGA